MVPLFHLQTQDLPADKVPAGAGMFHFVRAMMGAVGTSIFTTLWIRRSAFHHANLVSYLVGRKPFHPFVEQLNLLNMQEDKKWVFINQLVDVQAAVLAINDCFYLMGWCFLGLLPFLLIGRKRSERISQVNHPSISME